jgi:hypothetical protein
MRPPPPRNAGGIVGWVGSRRASSPVPWRTLRLTYQSVSKVTSKGKWTV